MKEIEYKLTMNSEQAKEVRYAVELLMRMKINQPEEISRAILEGMFDRIGFEEYLRRRDEADEHLKRAFNVLFPENLSEIRKDNEWYRLYNLYQVIRYAVHQAENPESKGVDSYPPMQFTDEPMPKCEWNEKKEV